MERQMEYSIQRVRQSLNFSGMVSNHFMAREQLLDIFQEFTLWATVISKAFQFRTKSSEVQLASNIKNGRMKTRS